VVDLIFASGAGRRDRLGEMLNGVWVGKLKRQNRAASSSRIGVHAAILSFQRRSKA